MKNSVKISGIVFLSMLLALNSCDTKAPESQHTVSVSGIGTVFVQPDMVQVHVNFSHVAPTTSEARRVVDETMHRILQILSHENIDGKFIKTVSLNYSMEYDYRSGRRVLIGQRAQQTIVFTVNDIVNNPERFPLLLDRITAIDRIEIHTIQFDVENKAEFFKQSRELAYQKAFEKAHHYAELSGRKIGKVLSLSEERSRDIAQTRAVLMDNVLSVAESRFQSSFVPAGELEITSEIHVSFSLK